MHFLALVSSHSVNANVRAQSRRRLDFVVLVLSATVLVLVLDGRSKLGNANLCSVRSLLLRTNALDRYTE